MKLCKLQVSQFASPIRNTHRNARTAERTNMFTAVMGARLAAEQKADVEEARGEESRRL